MESLQVVTLSCYCSNLYISPSNLINKWSSLSYIIHLINQTFPPCLHPFYKLAAWLSPSSPSPQSILSMTVLYEKGTGLLRCPTGHFPALFPPYQIVIFQYSFNLSTHLADLVDIWFIWNTEAAVVAVSNGLRSQKGSSEVMMIAPKWLKPEWMCSSGKYPYLLLGRDFL